jgi:hypothetical protein
MKKKLTEEEKKARKKAYQKANKEAIAIQKKAYRQANKESISIYKKAHYQANKEANQDKRKAYYQDNKESILIKENASYKANREARLIKQKAYDENNKDKIKARYESKRLPHHIVYCLPHYDKHGYMAYAGVTDNPDNRMRQHKSRGNNTDEWFVLHECETKKEALKIEREYHKKGYAGGQHHNKSKIN